MTSGLECREEGESIENYRNLAKYFRGGGVESKGEYRNLAKSREMILGLGVRGEYLKLLKSSEMVLVRDVERMGKVLYRNLANRFRGWGPGKEGGVSKVSEI